MKKVGQLFRETLVNRVKDGVNTNENTFIFTYSRLSGIQLSDLRKTLKASQASMSVSKNSIVRVALKELKCEKIGEDIDNQVALVWSNSDASAVVKILVKFGEEFESVAVKGGILDGKVLVQQDVKQLSELPPREVLLSMLLSAIQSPLTSFASALNAKTRELLSVLKQLEIKKK